jgi:hypothetical protein
MSKRKKYLNARSGSALNQCGSEAPVLQHKKQNNDLLSHDDLMPANHCEETSKQAYAERMQPI